MPGRSRLRPRTVGPAARPAHCGHVGLQDTGEEVDADVGIFVEWTARIFAKRDAGYFNGPDVARYTDELMRA
jgi:hypothetical protein